MFANLRAHLLLGTTALVGVMLTGQPVDAQETANLGVSAEVVVSCNVTGGTLDFGGYDPAATVTTDTSISVDCTSPSDVTISLDNGENYDGVTFRRVANGSAFISYNLYASPGAQDPWGNGNGTGEAQLVTVAGGSTAQQIPVYGSLLSAGPKPGGTYTDNVLISIAFQS